MKSIKIIISGRVQGVWFRKSTKELADKLGIVGTVRNVADGSIIITAQGEEPILNEFLAFCRTVPPLPKVKNVVIKAQIVQDLNSFEILR